MIEQYKEILLQSFLQEYSRIYLIDLEQDTIEKIMEADDVQEKDPVLTLSYSSSTMSTAARDWIPDMRSGGSCREALRISASVWPSRIALRFLTRCRTAAGRPWRTGSLKRGTAFP